MNSEQFEKKALDACAGLLNPGDSVAVGCSGGADSMALLAVLYHLRETLNLRVEAVTIDHGLRPASGEETAFVAGFCRERGIPCTVEQLTPGKDRSEAWARRERYRIFEKYAALGRKIATAHTASDQAETVLLHMARGTGLHGLSGIPACRGNVIRPLLWASRQDTEDYCRSHGILWVTDDSNLGDGYARNRVRHHALPALETVNPKAESAICRMADQLARLDGYLRKKAAMLLEQAEMGEGYSLAVLNRADWPIRETAIQLLVSQCRDADEEILSLANSVAERGIGAVQLTEEHRLTADGVLLTVRKKAEPQPKPEPQTFRMDTGTTRFGGYSFRLEKEKYESFVKDEYVHKKSYIFCADCAKIPNDLMLRGRDPGDRFSHPRRGQTKTIKKWMNELAIPAEQRENLPLLAEGNRVIFLWNEGFCRDAKPDENTEWVWILTQEREHNV